MEQKKNYVLAIATMVNGAYMLRFLQQESEQDFLSSSTAPFMVVRHAPGLAYVLAETFVYRPTMTNADSKFDEKFFAKAVGEPAMLNFKFEFKQPAVKPSLEVLNIGRAELHDGKPAEMYLVVANGLDIGVLSRRVSLLPQHYRISHDPIPCELTRHLVSAVKVHAPHISFG
jgi:hypothetical protein